MSNQSNFSATIEYLPGHRAAIIELSDFRGEWAGGFRFELPRAASTGRASLYEEGFRAAERAAAVKGGNLDRFSEYADRSDPPEVGRGSFLEYDAPAMETCGQFIQPALIPRPGNCVTVEIGIPLPRCRLKLPSHWTGTGASSLRWLGSGGSPLVFGPCTPAMCPSRANVSPEGKE